MQERDLEARTDLELVEAAFGGNVESFGELAGRYYTPIVALAHSKVGDRHLAEDIAQETFAKACFKLKELRDKRKFAGWLGAICRNICMDMLRGRRNFETSDMTSIAAERNVEEFEEDEQIRKVISRLPEKMRETIYLKFYDGMTYEKISEVLGISRQAINGRLRRAKRMIAKKLEAER